MIVGVVPIGGLGSRLGLPFSKEMLPQIGLNYYKPIADNLVSKMLEAGAEKIYFIHGFEHKQDVTRYYSDSKYIHITQKQVGFANTLLEYFNVSTEDEQTILFGMPDTLFRGNPFIDMVGNPGVVCGLFLTNDETKVDRLFIGQNRFAVKQAKTDELEYCFWGVLKFDRDNLEHMVSESMFDKYSEIGDIVNEFAFSTVLADKYLDLGIWMNYNIYVCGDYDQDYC